MTAKPSAATEAEADRDDKGGSTLTQPENNPDPWHMGPLTPDPGPALTAEEAEYYAYWDSMQLAYNNDRLDPEAEGGTHEAAFLRLAGRVPWEADTQAETAVEAEAEP
jgi:hypothetical protein